MMREDMKILVKYNLAEDYWLEKLKDAVYQSLYGDKPGQGDPALKTYRQYSIPFPNGTAGAMQAVTGDDRARAFLVHITAVNILAYKYLGSAEILIGTTGIKKDKPGEEKDVLLFFRTEITADSTPRELLNTALRDLNQANKHRRYEYESLYNRYSRENAAEPGALVALGIIDENFNRESQWADAFDILFRIRHHGGETGLTLRYDTRSYRQDQVEQLGRHYMNCMASMLEDLDKPVRHIEILSEPDHRRLLEEFSGEEVEYSLEEKNFITGFERQEARSPHAIALRCDKKEMSYRELKGAASRLARYFQEQTPLRAEDLVAILMERTEKMPVAIIAAWKCGAAYVPIDPDFPGERIEYMLKDSGAKILVTDRKNVGTGHCPVLILDHLHLIHEEFGARTGYYSTSLAYIIYTSGSTGNPKGVMVEHQGMMNHLYAKAAAIQISSGSVIAQNASQCFDISIWQFFAALLQGGQTVIYTNQWVLSPGEFIKKVGRDGVTILEVVPSYLAMVLEIIRERKWQHLFPALQYLLVTGETVKPILVRQWFEVFPHLKMVNAYGPTEASDDITHFIMDKDPGSGSIPIGRTVRNFRIYILDPWMNLCPVGVKGEICVTGIGVGRGYLNQPELTIEKFSLNKSFLEVQEPFFQKRFLVTEGKIYKTGDLARWQPDGNIEFFGRKDYQVKIRGYRIELEEIENKLSALPGIRDVVVIDREDKDHNKSLCAYITLAEGTGKKAEVIKRELRAVLPEYMIPSNIVVMEALPLTPNGKVDRKALPEPETAEISSLKYVPPRDAAEKKLAEIWQEILGIEKIGIHDNFFNLGGDSFKGIRIVNKIQEWLEEVVHVTILFLAPTIEELAAKLGSYKKETHTRVDAAKIEKMRRIIEPLPPLPPGKTIKVKNPPMLFILCPPRSGSTLLRVILTGHPGLFAPQEFELMTFNTLQERKQGLSGKFSFYLEGVIRAIMEMKHCDADGAKKIMEEYEARDLPVWEFYRELQQWLGAGRMLVEKTPAYTLDPGILDRIEEYFEAPYYIHLVRNPYAVIYSFENAKLDQLFKYDHDFAPRELAELVWLISHRNIVEFLKGIPAHRKLSVEYEELVRAPEQVVSGICDFLGLEYNPGMLKVYEEAGHRMTDGIYAESKMLGDVKFFTHTTISTTSIEKWKEKYKEEFLGEESVHQARAFGYLREKAGLDYSKLEPAPAAELYELSPAQKRLWILNRWEKTSIAYNIANAFIIDARPTDGNYGHPSVGRGKEPTQDFLPIAESVPGSFLEVKVLERAFETVVGRHESLRTTFITLSGEPWQKIHSYEDIGYQWGYVDLRNLGSREDRERELEKLATAERTTPFQLEKGPLLRTKLIRLEEEKYVFLFTMHHIISDGWSNRLLLRDILILYDAYKQGRDNPLPPLKFQYKDYSEWQNNKKIQETLKKQEQFWIKEFNGEIPVLNLPYDYPRPEVQVYEGSFVDFEISPGETEGINRLARSEGVSLFMVLLAAYNIFLSKMSSQEEIAVGTPTAGRNHPDLENIIGMFVNTLVLRMQIPVEQSFTGYLHQVKQKTLDVFENQEYPFEALVEKVKVEGDIGRNPLFDVMLVLQNISEVPGDAPIVEMPGITVKSYTQPHTISKFDMTLTAVEAKGKLRFGIEYCTKLFKEETIKRYTRYFKRILEWINQDPGSKISGIEILPEEEKQRLVIEFNRTEASNPREETLQQRLIEQAEQTPDRIALEGESGVLRADFDAFGGMTAPGDIRLVQLTYREVNEQSSHLANWLIEKGIRADSIVGIMLERSIEMVIGILAILKAGGAYMPIDPGYPQERIDFMLKDSGADVTLTAPAIEESINRSNTSYMSYISPGQRPLPTSLAYVIYTSGSTGRPKGVMVEQSAVVNVLTALQKEYPLGETDVILLKTSYVFDVSVTELFGWYWGGGRLAVLERGGEKDPGRILRATANHRVTHLNFVPSMFRVFAASLNRGNIRQLSTLRYIFLAGEALTGIVVERYRQWETKTRLENIYGPTEAAVYTSKYSLSDWDGRGNIPIGKPLQNLELYILDKTNHVQPIGVPGELCIAGAGLARGYLNNPELTEEKFIVPSATRGSFEKPLSAPRAAGLDPVKLLFNYHSPFTFHHSPLYKTGDPAARGAYKSNILYKTGDLTRWNPDGNIEFLGRIDTQVKLRGYRVELGEIENRLLSHGEIKEAVAVARDDQGTGHYLCAYIVARRELDIPGVQAYLAGRLPGYMVPSYIEQLEIMPLTPGGKIDRKALPVPGITPAEEYVAPGNEIEEKLVEIWSEVLGIEKNIIGINNNFFRMGGHSLKAAAVTARIHEEFDMEITLAELFKNPTIKGIGTLISAVNWADKKKIETEGEREKITL